MAARLTEKQKQKICADYALTESYRAAARLNGCSDRTVKRVVCEMRDFSQKVRRKKEQDEADVLQYMDAQRERVCKIIDIGLSVLPDRLASAKSASEVTTALGTIIDKWTGARQLQSRGDTAEDDALTASIRALGEKMEAERVRAKDDPAAE